MNLWLQGFVYMYNIIKNVLIVWLINLQDSHNLMLQNNGKLEVQYSA